MRIGLIFPQIEFGSDPVAIRDYAQAAEALGYSHLLVYDHVLGAGTASRPNWRGPYTSKHSFQEPFVLFGHLAAVTQRLELATGVIILPQRQTALVAKQAAEVDALSGGRLRLGVGIGWNEVEYEALGMNFRTRGAYIEEQVTVMRALWTQEAVTFHGRWHHISDAGINPLPVQRPIPIWMGGDADAVLRRAARMADGWMSRASETPGDREKQVARLRALLAEAGRDPSTFGIEGRAVLRQGGPDEWRQQVERWKQMGATHLSVDTMRAGFATPQAHLDAIRRLHDAMAG